MNGCATPRDECEGRQATDAPELQNPFERAADFFELCEGGPPRPDSALTELTHVPERFALDDLVAFGFWREELDGVVVLLREPLKEATWWIGLLLLARGFEELDVQQYTTPYGFTTEVVVMRFQQPQEKGQLVPPTLRRTRERLGYETSPRRSWQLSS